MADRERSWSEVDAILAQALEQPAAERAEWLRAACPGDPELVAEVERLLRLSESDDAALQPSHLAAFFHDALDTLGGLDDDDDDGQHDLAPGQRIGPYEIIELLGRGGMGCVYRARDVTLRREVAIKALAGSFTSDTAGLRRFGREARLLASLNHPNIATIYDLLQFEGRPYLILELVEGDTVAERLARRGPIPIGESVRAARQLAEALEEAHEKGVIHRDLKPSNVKLTSGGRVKVLDFGLAKLQAVRTANPPLSPSSATTRSGLVLGTPAYMSPEQARGQAVDRRTDVWSFGCLLFEMLTGERAFRGGSGFDVVASVLRDEVAWARLPPYTPAPVRRLLRRCLEKEAGARPQSMAEVRAALDEAGGETLVSGPRFAATPPASSRPIMLVAGLAVALALAAVFSVRYYAGSAATGPPSRVVVAVLPFRALDADSADYLADGLTEDLISQLGRIHPARLAVIARHTAMTYKDSRKEIEEIGRELPVQYVVEGSVRRQGDRLRVTAHLTRVGDLVTLWTESYDRTLGDVLALQAEVADEIARRIRVAVAPPAGLQRSPPPTVDPAAYDAYLQGRYHQLRGTSASTQQAIEAFQKAIELEPDFALAHAGLARSWVFGSRLPPAEALQLAREAAMHAVELDGSAPETRTALALARLYADWDWDGAIREFRTALELDPGNAETHYYLSHALTAAGRLDAAVASAREALALDPFSPLIQHYIGRLRYYQRDYDAALVEYGRAVDMDPSYSWTELFLSLTYRQLHRYDESVQHQQRYWDLMGLPPEVVQELGAHYRAQGFEAVLRERIADVEERTRETGYVSSMELALSYAFLGETEPAFRWLERSFQDHTRDLIYLAVEPGLDPLRRDPRFDALASRMGHPAASGAAPQEN